MIIKNKDLKEVGPILKSILTPLYETFVNDKLCRITISSTLNAIIPYTYSFPIKHELQKQNLFSMCPLLFSSLDLNNFYEILCNLYLEHTVIFVSENLNLLTSSM